MKFVFVLLFISLGVHANHIIINPHLSHSIAGEFDSNIYSGNKKSVQGLVSGIRILYRINSHMLGFDLEKINFKVNNTNDDDSFSATNFSAIYIKRFELHEFFGKFIFLGGADIGGLGRFRNVLGTQLGYNYRVQSEGVTKVILFAAFSNSRWSSFDSNLTGETYEGTLRRFQVGVSLPFEIDL